ncbi:MAG: ribonuclease E/G, partial [Undibacterium sp.]|nr:ribonuclease E/G [Undibacterium sp.]
SLVIRAIRDYFQPDIGEILIDTDDIYEQAQQFMSHVMPDMVHRVKRYSDDVPLFSRFQIEHQIETAYSRTVPLPSGGAIVIDHTEALVSVDVNSARSTRGGDIESTAFNTNCEAAEEVARQLRLRDLGGLIVIDFIDMENAKNQREVETRLKDALRYDRARVQMGKISRFGLMELSRQRLRPSLSEGSHVTCPRCNGTGHIRDTESSALQVLRIIQEEAMKENSAAIHVQVPVDVAAFLLNEKRGEILKIETRHRVTAILIPNKHLETPHYKLDRLKSDDPRLEEAHVSYAMAEQADTDIGYSKRQKDDIKPRQEAMVKSITPDTAPIVERKAAPVAASGVAASGGLFSGIIKFFSSLFGSSENSTPVIEEKPKNPRHHDRNGDKNRQRNRGKNGRGTRNEGEREDRPATANSNRTEKEAPAKLVAETAPATRPPKTPRPPREEKEAQGQKDGQKENQEARREQVTRTPRPPRPPREAREARENDSRKEQVISNTDAKLETKLDAKFDTKLDTKLEVNLEENTAATPVGLDKSKEIEGKLAVSSELDNIEQQAEEGRRRRRGGRNRNRRDRSGNESNDGQNNEFDSESKRDQTPAFVPVADLMSNAAPIEASKPIQASFDLAPAIVAETVEAAEASTPEVSVDMPVIQPTTTEHTILLSATAAVVISETTTPTDSETATATVADFTPQVADVVAPLESPSATQLASPLPTPAVAEVITASHQAEVSTAAVAEVISEVVEVITTTPASLIPAEAVPAEAAPTVVTPAIVVAVPAPDLGEVLASAGLILASTDPNKLKAAQAAVSQANPAPRLGRERKQVAVIATEPLKMVETKQ